jgi:hypothetical protein
MKNLRGPVLAATLTLALTAAGCAQKAEGDKAADKPADPKAALVASTSGLKAGNYAFTASTPDTQIKGVVDMAGKSAAISMDSHAADGPGKFEVRLVEPDRWVRMSFGAGMTEGLDLNDPAMKSVADVFKLFDGKTWLHVDMSKVKNPDEFDFATPDASGATSLLAGVVAAQGDAHDITGTIDATKAGDNAGILDSEDVKAMGAGAKALPFTAKLDDQGRLTHLEIDVPKAGETPAGKWTIDLTGYGSQQPLTKPTGVVKEMPDTGYSALDS